MEKVRNADLERQALLERLSDPGILPVITPGVGKGNFAEATIIAAAVGLTESQGDGLVY